MKNFKVKMLLFLCSCLLVACSALAFTACGEEHTHSYNIEKATLEYFKSPATCTQRALYYYSCSCGEKGEETFESGGLASHSFGEYVSDDNATCQKNSTETATCQNCTETRTRDKSNSKIDHIFENDKCKFCNRGYSEGLEFNLTDDKKSYILSGLGTVTENTIYIPRLYEGLPVTRIGVMAFKGNSSLTIVRIPDSVTSIGNEAFSGCSNLKNVIIPDSVNLIGDKAFYNCTSFTDISIPDGVEIIEESTFKNCYKITSITIPDSVTLIEEEAFSGCSGFTAIELPEALTSIGSQAFNGCRRMENIAIPASVTSIGVNVFGGCEALKSITVAEDNEVYKSVDGNLYNKSGVTLIKYAQGKSETSFTVPAEVKVIGNSAFRDCINLTAVSIDGVTMIDGNAFYNCSGLTGFEIPDSVTTIGAYAFGQCGELADVKIGGGVTEIGSNAFLGCAALTSITIPINVTTLGFSLFSSGAVTVYCEAEKIPSGWNFNWDTVSGVIRCPVVWDCNNNDKTYNGYAYAVIDGVRYSLKDGNAEVVRQSVVTVSGDITIPQTVTYKDTVYNVTSIANSAFYNCDKLTSVKIEKGVTSIGYEAFNDCYRLTSIIIPESVTTIDNRVFDSCSNLESITVAEGNEKYKSIDGNLYYIFESYEGKDYLKLVKYASGKKDTSFTLPEGTVDIGDRAFSDCGSLESAIIPEGISSIGEIFHSCSTLKEVTLPVSLKSIFCHLGGAFEYCGNLKDINFNGTKEQWNAITKDSNWDKYTNNFTIHCTDGDITKK